MSISLARADLFQEQAYINGQWVQSPAKIDVINPADGDVIAQVADCDAALVGQAIGAADEAFVDWAALTGKERSQILRRWFDLIIQYEEDLAKLLTIEQGKPVAEALGEIRYGASFVEWFAEEAKRAYGDIIPSTIKDGRMMVLKEPVGVCASITPWNFPNAMITRKVAPALAAGCTIVIKPSELTPLSALALAVLAQEAGMPAGVFNVVPASDAAMVGQAFCSDKRVSKISFTGSTRVGKLLMAQSADDLKRLSLELGGNAPFIVFEDADIDAAVEGAIASKFRNAGQTCVCANRFYIHDSIYDEFAVKFAEKVAALTVGNGVDAGVQVGPLITDAALEKVQGLVKDAVDQGAQSVVGGNAHALGGTYFQPTVLTQVNGDMRMSCEEIFGPVAPLYKFASEDQVVELANNTEYGLASYFYASDFKRVWRVAERLKSGIVCVNSGGFSTEAAPFGGVKHSGFGREGSRYGLEEYLDLKYVFLSDIA